MVRPNTECFVTDTGYDADVPFESSIITPALSPAGLFQVNSAAPLRGVDENPVTAGGVVSSA